MRQLNRLQSIVMLAGAFLMVAGAGLYVVGIHTATPWVFTVGAIAFAVMQMQQTYEGRNHTIQRLRRIMTIGDVLFILSALLMLEDSYSRVLLPLFTSYMENGYYQYVTYINNNWVILLLIAAVLEIYTTHRISHELDKEAKKL